MALAHTIALAAHVLFAAGWLGVALVLTRAARTVASSPDPAWIEATARMVTSATAMAALFYIFALANFVLGSRIGFEYGWPYHTSLTLGLLLLAVQVFIVRPAWKKVAAGDTASSKRFGLGIEIGKGLWLAMFILMYVGRGVLGA
ncbi:MAG: hypothetical protein AAF170_15970 [Bacteroidota bacterium]